MKSLLLLTLVSLLLVGTSHAQDELIPVGAITDLDLDRMTRLLGEEEERYEPPPTPRKLSLEEALSLALEANLRVQIARVDVEATAPLVDAETAFFHPTLGADGFVADLSETVGDGPVRRSDGRESEEANVFIDQQVPTGGTFRLGAQYARDNPDNDRSREFYGGVVQVRQPLLRGGRIFVATRRISDAQYDLEIEQAQLAAEILDITAQTKIAYYNTVLAGRLVEVIERAIARDLNLVEASEALFRAGRVTKRDVVSARIQLAGDRAELATRQGDEGVAQNALRDVLGSPIDLFLEVTDREVPFRPVESKLLQWIDRALAQRPELLEIKKRLEKAELETRVRGNDVLPFLDVFGAGRHDFRPGHSNWDWLVGGNFSIPIGNVAAQERLSSARARETRIRREYVQATRAIEVEVRQLEIRLRESQRRMRDLVKGLEEARAKREVALARFELGDADNLDVTDADDDIVTAESDLLRAVVAYVNLVALLEARTAGPI